MANTMFPLICKISLFLRLNDLTEVQEFVVLVLVFIALKTLAKLLQQ